MPTYQYSCTECGEQLEVVQSFSDPALTVCPACQGKLRKVFNSVGIVFKGSGFYRNDSRPGAKDGDKAEKKDGAVSSESTPATTTPAKSEPAAASTSTSTPAPAASTSAPKAGAASS